MQRNPHFDDNLLVWSDDYSGRYEPPASTYGEQFDLQWKLALEGDPEYYNYSGAGLDDDFVADRIYEWTGSHPRGNGFLRPWPGNRVLDHPMDPELIRGRDCIDIGCGLGRWTKVMLALGANMVMSVDVSASALKSVSRFNGNVRRVNVMEIPSQNPDLVARFDFACFWGVAMCTHDPAKAFSAAASTVRKRGALYLMVYQPGGMHGTRLVNLQRKKFYGLRTVRERLAYVDRIWNRRWDWSFPIEENLKNVARRVLARPKSSKMGILDTLEPFFNWVIPLEVVQGWMKKAGFSEVIHLNEFENPACAYHVLGIK